MAINTIICATKGSEECRIAEDKAIEIALENNSKLIFLYAIKEDEKCSNDILEEAAKNAMKKGIPNSKVLTEERRGGVVSQIEESVREHDARLVILGHPESKVGFLERQLLKIDGSKTFINWLQHKIGCEVMLV